MYPVPIVLADRLSRGSTEQYTSEAQTNGAAGGDDAAS
jgi:hypothetical protein